MTKKKALIAGATGVVGRNLLRQLLKTGEWEIVALSRRTPDIEGAYAHISVDLMNAAECKAKLGHLSDVTHIFFAALAANRELAQAVMDNLALLRNLVEAVEPVAGGLEHIHAMHGTKWYGMHLGPFKTPAREDDPRHLPPNFYYDQWDYLTERQKGKRWTYSSARPHAISGFALGNHSNLTMVIAIYAAICKELGLPLCHPGTPGNYTALYQCTDSGLLARAMVWMATTPKCANEAFNITNGDLIRWEHSWPKIARYFGMETGPRRPHQPGEVHGGQGAGVGPDCGEASPAAVQLPGDCDLGLWRFCLHARVRRDIEHHEGAALRVSGVRRYRRNVRAAVG